MEDRRKNLRIERIMSSSISVNDKDFDIIIIDISEEGIAFETNLNVDIRVGDVVDIAFEKLGISNLQAYVKDIVLEGSRIRVGCYVQDLRYTTYVQEQILMTLCGTNRNEVNLQMAQA